MISTTKVVLSHGFSARGQYYEADQSSISGSSEDVSAVLNFEMRISQLKVPISQPEPQQAARLAAQLRNQSHWFRAAVCGPTDCSTGLSAGPTAPPSPPQQAARLAAQLRNQLHWWQ